MELERSSSSSSNPKIYGSDYLQDQKANLVSFIRENESIWESIIQNFVISPEENTFELLEFAFEEMMKKNFNHLFKTLRKEIFLDLLNQCLNLENSALLLEIYIKLQDSNFSNYSLPSQIGQIIDNKLFLIRDQGNLNQKLFVDFYDNYLQSKKAPNSSFPTVIETYQRKITKTFTYVIQPYYENLKAKDLLFEALLIWMLVITHRQDHKDYKLVIDIAKIIKSLFVTKKYYGFSSEIDYEQFNKAIHVGFSAINREFKDHELIRPDFNFSVLIEIIDPDSFKTMVSKLIDRFCVCLDSESDIKNILGNLIEASYSQNVLTLLEILTNFYIKNQSFQPLFFIFKDIILQKLLNKLTSSKYFDKTLEILKLYLFGFSSIYALSYEKSNMLLKNYKIIFRHHKYNLQKFYEFAMCLFHLYKERKTSGDNFDIFDSLRRMKDTNGLETLTVDAYNFHKSFSFDLSSNQNIGNLINLFEIHGLTTPKNVKFFKGLQNLGNTCYMNSLLQCLFMTGKFKKEFLNMKYNMNDIDKNLLIYQLYQLLMNLSSYEYSQDRYIVPVEMKNSLPEPFCSSYQQQDACEFSRLLLEEIENQFNKIFKEINLINSLFYGKVKNTIRCTDCNKSFSRQEDLMDIPLSFSEGSKIESEIPRYDLLQMILSFFATEEFIDDNSFFCDNCKRKSSKAIKETLILKLPPILILSINRFKYDKKEETKKKLFQSVKPYFSFNLTDIFPELPCPKNKQDLEYYMYGIIIHSGFSAETGHYFSMAKDSDDLWYLFNDTNVRFLGKTVNLDEILLDHETPYMFFFANRSENPLTLNYTERKSIRQSVFLSHKFN